MHHSSIFSHEKQNHPLMTRPVQSIIPAHSPNLTSKRADTPRVLILKHTPIDTSPASANRRLLLARALDEPLQLIRLSHAGVAVEVIDAQTSQTHAALPRLLHAVRSSRSLRDLSTGDRITRNTLRRTVRRMMTVMVVVRSAVLHAAGQSGPGVLETLEHGRVLGTERGAAGGERGRVHAAGVVGDVAHYTAVLATRDGAVGARVGGRHVVCVLVGHLVALGSAVRGLGSAELEERDLEVVEGTFDEGVALLEVQEEVVPEWVLAEDLRVAKDDQTVLGTGEGDV